MKNKLKKETKPTSFGTVAPISNRLLHLSFLQRYIGQLAVHKPFTLTLLVCEIAELQRNRHFRWPFVVHAQAQAQADRDLHPQSVTNQPKRPAAQTTNVERRENLTNKAWWHVIRDALHGSWLVAADQAQYTGSPPFARTDFEPIV